MSDEITVEKMAELCRHLKARRAPEPYRICVSIRTLETLGPNWQDIMQAALPGVEVEVLP